MASSVPHVAVGRFSLPPVLGCRYRYWEPRGNLRTGSCLYRCQFSVPMSVLSQTMYFSDCLIRPSCTFIFTFFLRVLYAHYLDKWNSCIFSRFIQQSQQCQSQCQVARRRNLVRFSREQHFPWNLFYILWGPDLHVLCPWAWTKCLALFSKRQPPSQPILMIHCVLPSTT